MIIVEYQEKIKPVKGCFRNFHVNDLHFLELTCTIKIIKNIFSSYSFTYLCYLNIPEHRAQCEILCLTIGRYLSVCLSVCSNFHENPLSSKLMGISF